MTVAYWCVLVAGLLPYLTVAVAKLRPGYDNRDPRAWLEQQAGWRKLANNAQLNGFEAFPLFAAAVIIAHLSLAPQPTVDALAAGFIVARVLYTWAYVSNRPTLRSAIWTAGIACPIALFFVAAAGR
jgi:uncharacterized MAPEG superfamily protein